MSAVALLDVNVLVALFDPDHVHHDIAHDWFSDEGHAGWATCPLTENGFVRVVANLSKRAQESLREVIAVRTGTCIQLNVAISRPLPSAL